MEPFVHTLSFRFCFGKKKNNVRSLTSINPLSYIFNRKVFYIKTMVFNTKTTVFYTKTTVFYTKTAVLYFWQSC